MSPVSAVAPNQPTSSRNRSTRSLGRTALRPREVGDRQKPTVPGVLGARRPIQHGLIDLHVGSLARRPEQAIARIREARGHDALVLLDVDDLFRPRAVGSDQPQGVVHAERRPIVRARLEVLRAHLDHHELAARVPGRCSPVDATAVPRQCHLASCFEVWVVAGDTALVAAVGLDRVDLARRPVGLVGKRDDVLCVAPVEVSTALADGAHGLDGGRGTFETRGKRAGNRRWLPERRAANRPRDAGDRDPGANPSNEA